MRFAVVIALVSGGCSLYFGHGHSEDDVAPPPEIPPDSTPDQPEGLFFCEGGTIYETFTASHTDGTVVRSCPNGCATTTLSPYSANLCLPTSPEVFTCTENGACATNATDGCPATLQCGVVVSAGACSCDSSNIWECADACNGGLCGAAQVQTAIAGDWTGTVTPPSFSAPYQVRLHIGPNGLWYGTATGAQSIPFYYGDNGNNLGSRIVVQAQTTVGAYASIGLFDGEVQGMMNGLTVDAHHLKFAFLDSWLSCGRTFYFDLSR